MASRPQLSEHGERQQVTDAGQTVIEMGLVGGDRIGESPGEYAEQCYVETAQEVAACGFSLGRDFTLQPHRDEQDNIINPNFVFKPDVLCSNCSVWAQKFHRLSTARNNHTPVHSSYKHLWQCAKDGCHMCLHIGHRLDYYTRRGEPFVSITLKLWDPPKKVYLRRPMQVLPETHQFESLTASQHTALLHGYNEPIVSCLDHLTASNAADVYIQEASSRLKECLSSHPRCKTIQMCASPPTRLVKVGSLDSRPQITYPMDHVDYAAVSHCWGSSRSMLLTKSNHRRLVNGFDEEQLPRLFRDCVMVARRMGIEYLWIDSLCIIQDSRNDWKYEAKRMGDVYCGSLFTISAAAATGCHESLFTKYHPLGLRPYTMERRGRAIGFKPFEDISTPLYDRAWVLQEILLSTRILAYTNSGVSWRCQTDHVGSYSDRDRALISFEEFSFVQDWNELILTDEGTKYPPVEIVGKVLRWIAVMNKYLSMDITYETDRPYAMKGIVTNLQQRAGLDFVAETCAQFLPYSLLWTFKTEADTTIWSYDAWRSSLTHSPSWSGSFRHRTSYVGPRRPLEGSERSHLPTKVEIRAIGMSRVLHIVGRYHGSKLRTKKPDTHSVVVTRKWAELPLTVHWDFYTTRSIKFFYVLLGWGEECASTYGLVLTQDLGNNRAWERIGIFQANVKRLISRFDIEQIFDEEGEFLVK